MFNLFKKKEDSIKVIDKIWMSRAAKWKGILDLWRKDPSLIIVTWFDETNHELTTLFSREATSDASIYSVRELHRSQLAGKTLIFAEHHPLRKKEQEVFRQWQLREAVVHSALDESFFKHLGSDKIIGMMKQLGMSEEAVIEHKMISNAIVNAQEKIENKVQMEHTASSQDEWMERNLRG
jgi:hypothetical protein